MIEIAIDYHLQLVTDHQVAPLEELPSLVEQAILGGVNCVQLRDKVATDQQLIDVGKQLKILLQAHSIPLLINDRVNVAMALDADGVHLGQTDMPYQQARQQLGHNKMIGLTVNTLDQAMQINFSDIDYLGVGPIFPTKTKIHATKPLGLDGLKRIRAVTDLPLIAIGGIQPEHTQVLLEAGADGIAIVSAILNAPQPQQVAHRFKEKLV